MKRVVAIMGWRISITIQSVAETDFVHSLGDIALLSLLEVWLGITIACLPTITPFLSKYVKPILSKISGGTGKQSVQRQLREATHTIGSSESRGFRKKNFNRLDTESFLELEEGSNIGSEATVLGSTSKPTEVEEHWMSDPNAIGVRHDVQVTAESHKR